MQAAIAKQWDDIRASYWFTPALMALAAIGLAIGLVVLDESLKASGHQYDNWLLVNRPEGARALLAAIAGSMITVAGVTFSVTISAVAHATAQFGPRLLTNFMQDRGNQITLGTFIATFIYCLLVLRTVRNAQEIAIGAESSELTQAFVPQFAMLGALGLALASVAVLIYFIHHVPATIHISNVAARIGRELKQQIEQLCPPANQSDQTTVKADNPQLNERIQAAAPIRADCDGYLQHVSKSDLLSVAVEHDLLLFVVQQPGDFVIERRALVYAWPPIKLSQAIHERLSACFAFGTQRTQSQDPMFLVQELVEISVRALSPGINDPFTAINCMNWLAGALSTLATRQAPTAYHYDTDGKLRVVLQAMNFQQVTDAVFDGLRPYARRDLKAALYLLHIIAEIAPDVTASADRKVLMRHAELLSKGCAEALNQAADRETVRQRCDQVLVLLKEPSARVQAIF